MNTPTNMINPNPQPMANAGFSQPQFRNIPIILVNSMDDVKAYQLEELYNEGIGPHDEAVVVAGIRMIEQNR